MRVLGDQERPNTFFSVRGQESGGVQLHIVCIDFSREIVSLVEGKGGN